MKEKKPLTIKQQKHRYTLFKYLLIGGEYVSTLLPYGIMAIVNREEWFVYNPEPWKVGLGGSIGMVLLSLALFLITKRQDKPTLTNGMIALLVGWYTVTFAFFLLAQINMEIYKIMAYGGLGLFAALGLDVGAKNFEKKASELGSAMKQAESNLKTEQATKEILEQEKKKKKVNKVAVD